MIPDHTRERYAASVRDAEAAIADTLKKLDALPPEIVSRLGRLMCNNAADGIQGLRTGLRCMLAMDSCEDACPHRDLPYYGFLLPQKPVTELPKAS